MRDKLGPGTTLSYCTNVHPCASVTEFINQIETHTLDIKAMVAPNEPFAIGAWLPLILPKGPILLNILASLVKHWLGRKDRELEALKKALSDYDLEISTFNVFPLNQFHDEIVKRKVYAPDWTDQLRLIHSFSMAVIMGDVNPTREGGSLSTLPIGWRSVNGRDDTRIHIAAEKIRQAASILAKESEKHSLPITLDLEPEPGCILDTADDVIAFFDEHLPDEDHRRYIGVCHDICHAAVMFEDQREVLRRYAEAGIRVNKVQISSALDVDVRMIGVEAAIEHLRPFAEPRYLHQTGFLNNADDPTSFELIEDLPEAIERLQAGDSPDRLRVHFHVPVYLDRIGPLGTTNDQIADAIAAAREYHDTKHFEVETYAWGVLPDELKRDTLAEGIADELKWVLDTCGEESPSS